MLYSDASSNYSPYSGELIEAVGRHYFTLRDIVGNEVVFTITIDRNIDYMIEGTYVEQDGSIYSRTGIVISVNEKYDHWSVENASGVTFEPGEKINIEGEYTVAGYSDARRRSDRAEWQHEISVHGFVR